MKKIMISQPMNGYTYEQITNAKQKFLAYAEENGFEPVNTHFKLDEHVDTEVNISILYLSKAINAMSQCAAVYFAEGWNIARGCRVEHKIAKEYGLEVIYEGEIALPRDTHKDS